MKKWLMPILAMLGALLAVTIMMYPMLTMEIKDITIGVLSLDEGVETDEGSINAGSEFIKSLSSTDTFDVKEVSSEKELDDNFDDGDYYATIVIPEDFTLNSASGEDTKIDVVINEGKNPMVSMTLSTLISALGQASGVEFNIETINELPEGGSAMTPMLLPMALVMFTYMSSLISSMMLTRGFKLEGTKREKVKKYFVQLCYMIVLALAVGFIVSSVVSFVSDVDFDIPMTGLYLSTVSFAFMLLVNGSVNLLGTKGIIVPGIIFALGMSNIQLPYEYLTSGYQTLVASWEPLRYVGCGIREVLYQGSGVWNSASIALIIVALVGILFSVIKLGRNKELN